VTEGSNKLAGLPGSIEKGRTGKVGSGGGAGKGRDTLLSSKEIYHTPPSNQRKKNRSPASREEN